MRMTVLAVTTAIALFFASGCLRDDLLRCGDLLCAPSAVCMADRCVERLSLDVCDGHPEGDACTFSRVPSGSCIGGECVERRCGNGFAESNEICDDGNTENGDGCAGDCAGLDKCPSLGTSPVFAEVLAQYGSERCLSFSESRDADWAVLHCLRVGSASSEFVVLEGPRAGPWAPVSVAEVITSAFITPEGDQVFATIVHPSTMVEHVVYRREGTQWIYEGALAIPSDELIGMPSRGPKRRLIASGSNGITEYEVVGSQATMLTNIPRPSLASSIPTYGAQMSGDGRRLFFGASGLVLGASNAVYMMDRPSLDQTFSSQRVLQDLDIETPITVTDDCDRLYLSIVGRLFVTRQVGAK